MLIAGSHSQVFVTEQERHGVNVRALHPEPACRRVPEIVKVKIEQP